MIRNIVLVGFMASGKTTAARLLAQRLKMLAVSTDESIEQKTGCTISELFAAHGEAYFRQIEADVVKDVSSKGPCIIDCGGGAVLNQSNLDVLKACGTVFYLAVDPDVVLRRAGTNTQRPLLNVDNPLAEIKRLLKNRAHFYEQADYTLNANNDDFTDLVNQIITIVQAK